MEQKIIDKYQLYLAIIACGLNPQVGIKIPPPFLRQVDWENFFQFCEIQAITGIGLQALESIRKMFPRDVEIKTDLLFQWIGLSEQIRYKNILVNKRCGELGDFLSQQGKESRILKGQGNALMYPQPSLRTPGDIDVWIKGSKKEVVKFVQEKFPDERVQYHHMNYRVFDDVEVEVHYYPSFCYNKIHNKRLQSFFQAQSSTQFLHPVKLDGSDIAVNVPTVLFNLVFQLSHMMRHFFTQGIGLRQMIDYFYLLRQEIDGRDKREFARILKRCGMYKFFCAVLWIEKCILDLEVNTDIAEPNERAGKLVLHEILKGGNFGFQYRHTGRSDITTYINQIIYNLRYVCEFPSEPLWRPFTLAYDYINKRIRFR